MTKAAREARQLSTPPARSDAPGRDSEMLGRPPDAIRLYSRDMDVLGSRMTIYELPTRAGVQSWIDEERRARGLVERPSGAFVNRRILEGPGGRVVVTSRVDERRVVVTVVELFGWPTGR